MYTMYAKYTVYSVSADVKTERIKSCGISLDSRIRCNVKHTVFVLLFISIWYYL